MGKKVKPQIPHIDEYDVEEVIKCKDRYQAYLYIKHGLSPYDVFVSGEDMIFIFPKNELCKKLYAQWRSFNLK